jgi:hypothetical protein
MARRPGFSLVLALTVMSLMVLVILSLAGLLAVESRIATQGQALRSARLNALAAGRLALAQLQQLAGADQRVTARADLLDPAHPGSTRNTGIRLTTLNPARALWTGVWMTGPGAGGRTRSWDPAAPDARVFLGWLVSPSPAGEALQSTPSSTLTPSQGLAQAPSNLTAENMVPLLGRATLGEGASASAMVGRPSVTLPGCGGKIAWWTADEGLKARVNLIDPRLDIPGNPPTPPTGLTGWILGFRLTALGQSGAAPATSASPTAGLREARDGDARSARERGLDAAPLLAVARSRTELQAWASQTPALDAASAERLAQGLGASWHDLTGVSRGLMTNTLDGGLRIDLSTAFELPWRSADGLKGWRELDCFPRSPDRNTLNLSAGIAESTEPGSEEWNHGDALGYLFEVSVPEEESRGRAVSPFTVPGPTWDLLRAHYRLYKREAEARSQPGVPWTVSPDAWLARGSAPFTFLAGSPIQGATRPHPSGTPGLPSSPPALFGPKANLAALQPIAAAAQGQPRHARVLTLEDGSSAVRIRDLRARLAPLVTRIGMIHSLIYCQDTLAIGLDAFLAVHNPYDVPLELAGIGVTWAQFNNTRFNIYRADNPNAPVATCTLGNDLRQRSYTLRGFHTYPPGGQPAGRWGQAPQAYLRLEPGETRILTPNLAGNRWQVYRAQAYQNISMAAFAYDLQSNFRINAHRLPDMAELRENEAMLSALVAPAPGASWSSEPLVAEILSGDASQVNAFDTHLYRANRYATSSSAPGWWAWLGDASLPAGSDHADEHLLQRVGFRASAALAPAGSGGSVRSQPFTRSPARDGTRNLPDKRFFAVTELRLRSLAEPNGFPAPVLAANPRAQLADPRNWDGNGITAPSWQASLTPLSGDPLAVLQFWPGNTPEKNQASWGESHLPGEGTRTTVLFQVPRRPLLSLAQLAHADIGEVDLDPSYAIGNSFAHPGLDRLDKVLHWPASGPSGSPLERVDLAYAANLALWDRTFFSGLSAGTARAADGSAQPHTTLAAAASAALAGEPESLANSRFRPWPSRADTADRAGGLLNPATTARQLIQEGTFNVNSTSAAAWKAQLTGGLGALAEGLTQRPDHPFSRLHPPAGESAESGEQNRWRTYRSLAEDSPALDRLAEAIVAEVRARGPFMCLADFVNRRLTNDGNGRKGALQAAIDAAGLNAATAAPGIGLSALGRIPQAAALAPSGVAAEAPVALGQPDMLLQSDILAAIGPHLSARSDTFVIRAYGESRGAIAWCEITVQRTPDWVRPQAEDATLPRENYRATLARTPGSLADMHAANPSLAPVNRALGRRFALVDFRWIHAP